MTNLLPRKRGRCRYCGRTLGLTKNGLVHRHYTTAGTAATAKTGSRIVCGGSGQVPS